MLVPLAVLVVGLALSTFLPGLLRDGPPEGSKSVSDPGILAPFFTPSIDYWHDSIATWSANLGLDPNLIATVMQIESCGDPQALSPAGASGLFQVMPFHFAEGEDPYDPPTNAGRGLSYLQSALEASSGDVRLALAGYNGGIGLIGRGEETWPDETIRYAAWGSGIYREALESPEESETLNTWLTSGGWRLCAQAVLRLGLQE